ncbi:MAG: protein kinase, partial [Planctomycetes bacterium]|nr:protein kinase [Planctomycetota bacterium]
MAHLYRGTRYQVLETLGEGGTGSVYRARDLLDGRAVALKVFAAEGGGDPGGAARLLARSEFRVLASQSHPGVVRVFDYGTTDDGLYYFTMELLEAQDLLRFAREVAPGGAALGSSEELALVVRQVLEALEHVHGRGVLHLDIKPSNVLVARGEDGRPVAKLIDFGFARDVAKGGSADAVSGTVEYLAPERLRGEAPTARSDLYALGVALYEVFTGSPPFRGATPGEVVRRHLEGAVPRPEALPERYRTAVLKLLEKQPSRRPASARAVLEELFGPPAAGDEALPPFGAAFVGREDLLRRLEAAARAARDGTPGALLVRGPAGAGKTRLLRELEVRLQLGGVLAGVETCRGGSRPGELLVRLLRRASLVAGAASRDVAADLETLLAGAAGGPGRIDAAEVEGRRDRLLHRVASRVLELASTRLVVLLADDVHLADSLSLEGLLVLLRAAALEEGARLCVVLAARDEEPADLQALGELAGAARALPGTAQVQLEGLSEPEVEVYLARALGHGAFPPELARTLAAETGGNAFFLEEYLKLLVRSGRLRRSGSSWTLPDGEGLDVPRTVGDAVARRLERVAGRRREGLQWAAVVEAPVTAGELAACLGDGATSEEAERLLDGLALEGFLVREGSRYAFAHAAARGAALDSLPAGERRRRHGIVAKRLLEAGDVQGRLEDVARHLYLSSEPRRAREHLLRAGDRAWRSGALREAALHLTRALEVTEDDAGRFDALLRREEVLGHLGRRAEQREDLERLRSLAASLGGAQRLREAALREALYLESLGRKREALERLEEAIARCDGDDGEGGARARLLSRSGLLRFYLSEFDAGFDAVARALEHARAAGDRGLEAECRQVAGLGRFLRGEHERALEEMGQALAMRREEGEEHRAGAIESNLGLIHLERGDLEAAEERFLGSLKTLRRIGHRRGEAVNLVNLGLVHLEMGRPERALDSIGASLRIRRELGDRRGEGADLGNLAAAWIQLGRLERAVPLLEDALRIAREHENRGSEAANLCRLAQVDLERGDAARALERLGQALETARKTRLPAQEVLARMGLARARLALAEAAAAREEAEAALGLAVSARLGLKAAVCRSLLAAALRAEGRLDDADRASREAVEDLQRQRGGAAEGHLVWFERALVLEARGVEAPAEEALRRSYALLREKADAVQDDELRQGYLEGIPLHREIDRRHEALQAQTRREAGRRERSFHEIAKSIHGILEVDPLLDRLLELAIETTHAEKGLIVLKNPGGDFTIRAARGMARESVDDAAEICRSVIADVARGGGAVLAADAGSDERFRDRRSIISFKIRTLMCVPLAVRDEIIGAAYVDGRGASSFGEEDLEYLVSFAQLAAVAVENARLLEKLRAENIYLRREVETRYRFENLIGASPAMQRVARVME